MDRKLTNAVLIGACFYLAALATLCDQRDGISAPTLFYALACAGACLAALNHSEKLSKPSGCWHEIRAGLALMFFGFLSQAAGGALLLAPAWATLSQQLLLLAGLTLLALGAGGWIELHNRTLAQLRDIAVRDPVTGLLNRRGFLHAAAAYLDDRDGVIAGSGNRDAGSALLAVEIEGFQALVDQHGEDLGDSILSQFAKYISDAFRPTDPSAHWGGGRFMVLLPHCSEQQCGLVAQRLKIQATDHALICNGVQIKLRICCGIAARGRRESIPQLLSRASYALKRAHDSGSDQFFYTPQIDAN